MMKVTVNTDINRIPQTFHWQFLCMDWAITAPMASKLLTIIKWYNTEAEPSGQSPTDLYCKTENTYFLESGLGNKY